MSAGLLDTSALIAGEAGRPLDTVAMPDDVFVSVVTIAELHAGVLVAADVETRARRLMTLESIAMLEPLTVDVTAAMRWAALRVTLAESGRRMNVNDLWIAAIAMANSMPVITQDDDFDALRGVRGFEVIAV